jgi:hypothetical protein
MGMQVSARMIENLLPLQLAKNHHSAFTKLWCHSARMAQVLSFEALNKSFETA